MKDKRKYFFVGARFFTLEKMLDMKLNISCIAAPKGSFLEKELVQKNIKYTPVSSKKELLNLIEETEFDVLVSNGCPYILPISKIQKNNELFVNIHPSLLPDLKGFSPVNGAILFNRPQGATCHLMNDGIDTGDIISQVEVTKKPRTIPLDVLYQLSFMAEAKAFEKAYKNDFKVAKKNRKSKKAIYYTRKDEDQELTRNDSLDSIVIKVKSYQVNSQYAFFVRNDIRYKVIELSLFDTKMFDEDHYKNYQIIRKYENNIIVKIENKIVLFRLDNVDGLNEKDLIM